MKLSALVLAGAVLLGVAGCASEIKRDPGATRSSAVLPDPKFASVKVYLNDNAQKLLADNIKFNPDALRSMIQRTLEARRMVVAESPNRLEVEVTDLRVRSNVAAVLFGFMAGSDLVQGNVYVIGKDGKALAKFEVSASYALGGLAGGQDETRTSWLYEEFAKLTVKELIGEKQ
jgi:hypothetical protein